MNITTAQITRVLEGLATIKSRQDSEVDRQVIDDSMTILVILKKVIE